MYKQIIIIFFKWNLRKIVMIRIKHFEMNQILALNNPLGVDMLLDKSKP